VGSNPTSTATDLQEHWPWQPTGGVSHAPVGSLAVSNTSGARSRRQDQLQLLCLVTDTPDRPERRGTPQSVCPIVQGWPEPSGLMGAMAVTLTFVLRPLPCRFTLASVKPCARQRSANALACSGVQP